MSNTPPPECIYLSDSWGVHDQRWCQALESLGYSVSREMPSNGQSHVPIIVGPLTSIDHSIFGLTNPVIGLSWGFDLHELNAANETRWLPQLSGLIVDSQPTLDIALKAGLPAEKIAVIPWGIDVDQFTPHGEKVLNSLPRLLTLRAHEPLYQVDTVIKAVKLLHDQGIDCELIVGNSGSITQQLMDLVAELKISHVTFIGRSSEGDLPALFESADVYISAAETDGTSVTLLQSMSMKIPVVVSDSPGNKAIVNAIETPLARGTLFTTGDPSSLARAIASTLSDPAETQSKTDAAWEYVQEHANWDRNIQRLLPLLAPR